jgi:competence protein ComEC
MLPVLLWQSPRPDWGQFELWALDIGQGNAVLLRTQNHALLYDAGPAWGESSDAGQRVLVPFMAREGVKLNRLMLSHRDADHTGGAASVLAAHPQADLWASLEPDHPLAQLRQVEHCRAGQRWVWDGVQFEVLHPALADQASPTSTNAVSCVLRIDTGQGQTVQTGHDVPVASALLPGDIEALQELELLNKQMLKPVDFLLVPHHGSQTSSTRAFVQTLSPKWAMVQSGYRNRYGHPAPQVVLRYQQLGVPMLMSPVCGAAHWQSTQPQQLDCERDKNRRYWHFRPPSVP